MIETYEKQLDFIRINKLQVKDVILVKGQGDLLRYLVVTSLHTMYGWICADNIRCGGTAYNIPIENIKAVFNRRTE